MASLARCAGCGEFALVLAIGDERGLHQHRGNIGRLEHHESRLLHARFAHFADTIQRLEHIFGGHHAGRDAGGLREIQQHAPQHRILVIELDAALEVRRVFALGQPARGFARRTAIREHVHRRTGDVRICNRVGMNRHEQVGFRAARAQRALLQADEIVAVAREHGLHAGLLVDAHHQCPGDFEYHILFTGAAAPGSTWIHAAMSGVHRDDDVAATFGRRMRRTDRDWRRGGDRNDLRSASAGAGYVEHQAMTGVSGCRQYRRLDGHRTLHLEHQPQAAVRQFSRAHRGDGAFGSGQLAS